MSGRHLSSLSSSPKTNLVLIGMPGAGKSTVGVILAKLCAKEFIDTDLLIQSHHQHSLQEILDTEGYQTLRDYEEDILQQLNVKNSVISTGGSAVYSKSAMQHLQQNGLVVYLDVPVEVLEQRITNYHTRGIAKPDEQSFDEVFQERTQLYQTYADITVDGSISPVEAICDNIMNRLG